jgi:predicted ATPase
MASASGRGFDFRLLRALTPQVSEDQLLEAIDEALGSHLIEGLPGGVERYQFNHAMVQQTLSEALSASRRARLHARIAEALEALYGADVEAHAAELAHHFAEAEPVLGIEKLVNYSLLAGERALAAYAWEEAQAHFQRGLAAKGVPLEDAEPAEDAESARLLFGLGRARRPC